MLNKFHKLLIIFMMVFIGACADDSSDGTKSPDLSNPKWDGVTATEIIPVGNVYEVSHANHLAWISSQARDIDSFLGKTIKFINDIDMDSKYFSPLEYFAGDIDGNGKSIHNLEINTPIQSAGLISSLRNNTNIKDLTIASGNIRSTAATGSFVGLAWGENTTITNCVNHASVAGSSGVGGIIGIIVEDTASLTITNTKNFGTITASNKIPASGKVAGGIIGIVRGDVTIKNCENTKTVEGENGVGGIVGYSWATPLNEPIDISSLVIDNSSNSGNIKGNSSLGGIVGSHHSYKSSIDNSSNSGDIVGTSSSIGGIVGSSSGKHSIKIINSSNSGNITGKISHTDVGYAGGIIGAASSKDTTLTNVYSYANITSKPKGGIFGSWADVSGNTLTITNSYWLDTGSDKAIGDKNDDPSGVSKLTADQFNNTSHTYFIDWDFVNTWEILPEGLYPTLKKR